MARTAKPIPATTASAQTNPVSQQNHAGDKNQPAEQQIAPQRGAWRKAIKSMMTATPLKNEKPKMSNTGAMLA